MEHRVRVSELFLSERFFGKGFLPSIRFLFDDVDTLQEDGLNRTDWAMA